MLEFTSLESGPYGYTIEPDQIPEGMWDPTTLKGERVILDGKEIQVRAVETFAVNRSSEFPYRLRFGIIPMPESSAGIPVEEER